MLQDRGGCEAPLQTKHKSLQQTCPLKSELLAQKTGMIYEHNMIDALYFTMYRLCVRTGGAGGMKTAGSGCIFIHLWLIVGEEMRLVHVHSVPR